jgi:hypothetical protein
MTGNDNHKYHVRVDWSTALPLGDTLAIDARHGFDERWVSAFGIVLGEHERRAAAREWGKIDFEHVSDEKSSRFVLYVRKVKPSARSGDLRQTLDDLVKAANTVAQVGTHVYELARELREPDPATPRSSTPPPSVEQPADELSADPA